MSLKEFHTVALALSLALCIFLALFSLTNLPPFISRTWPRPSVFSSGRGDWFIRTFVLRGTRLLPSTERVSLKQFSHCRLPSVSGSLYLSRFALLLSFHL